MSEINSFISKEANNEILTYIANLEKIAGRYKDIAVSASNLEKIKQQEQKTEQDLLKTQQLAEVLAQKKAKTDQENIKSEIQLQKILVENEKVIQAKNKTQIQENKIKDDAKKKSETHAKVLEKESSAYEKLKKNHSDAVKKTRELASANKQGTEEFRKAQAEAKKYGDQLKKVNDTTGAPATNNVGKYFQAIMKGAGAIGLAVGASQLLSAGFNKLKESSMNFADTFSEAKGGVNAQIQKFFSMIGSGDFSNFIENMKRAGEAGRAYDRGLQDYFEGSLSLQIKEAESRLKVAELKTKQAQAKTKDEQDEYGRQILAQINSVTDARLTEAKAIYENERDNITSIANIREEDFIKFITDYRANGKIRESAEEKQQQIIDNLTIKHVQGRNFADTQEAIKAGQERAKVIQDSLTTDERLYLEFNKQYQGLTDEQIKKTITAYYELTNVKAQQLEEGLKTEKKLASDAGRETIKREELTLDKIELLNNDTEKAITAFVKEQMKERLGEQKSYTVELSAELLKRNEENMARINKERADEQQLADDKIALIRKVMDYTALGLEAGQMIGNEIFNRQSVERDMELEAIQQNYDKKMILAGDDKKMQLAAERQMQKEKNKIFIEQAKADKKNALFNIAINTAMAVSKTWAETGVFGIVAQIPVLAMGALQAGLVASRPLPAPPAFWMGTDSTPDTFIAGDKGKELVITKTGETFVTPNKATMYSGLEGSAVIPNAETLQILANSAMKPESNYKNELRDIKKAIKENRPVINIINKNGDRMMQRYDAMRK